MANLLLDWRLSRAWIGLPYCQFYREGVAGTNKDWDPRDGAVSFTAAGSLNCLLSAEFCSSVDFSCSVPLSGCLATASGEETDPLSVREM